MLGRFVIAKISKNGLSSGMNRPLAVLGAFLILAMFVLMVLTEDAVETVQELLIHTAIEIVVFGSLLLYCGFAILHAVQHVADPVDRMGISRCDWGSNFNCFNYGSAVKGLYRLA